MTTTTFKVECQPHYCTAAAPIPVSHKASGMQYNIEVLYCRFYRCRINYGITQPFKKQLHNYFSQHHAE